MLMLGQPAWRPFTDIYETPRKIRVIVELAGVVPDALEVVLYDNALVVKGQRQLPVKNTQRTYHVAEIRQGPFCLEVPLTTAVDPEQVEVRYERGLLKITLIKNKGVPHDS